MNNFLSYVLERPTKICASSSLNHLDLTFEDRIVSCLKDLISTLERYSNKLCLTLSTLPNIKVGLTNFQTLVLDNLERFSTHRAAPINADDELLLFGSLTLIKLELIFV